MGSEVREIQEEGAILGPPDKRDGSLALGVKAIETGADLLTPGF